MNRFLILSICLFATKCIAGAPKLLDDEAAYSGLTLLGAKEAAEVFKEAQVPKRLLPKDGVVIAAVQQGAPAATQGAKPMDVITYIAGRRVKTLKQWQAVVAKKKPGDVLVVKIKRFTGVWQSITGKLELTTKRKAFYGCIKVSESSASGTLIGKHRALGKQDTMLAPLIVVSDGIPSLSFDYKHRGDRLLFPTTLTIRTGNKTQTINLPVENIETDILVDESNSVFESIRFKMPSDAVNLLRSVAPLPVIRADGRTRYTEFELPSPEEVRVILAVYDDMIARKATSFK